MLHHLVNSSSIENPDTLNRTVDGVIYDAVLGQNGSIMEAIETIPENIRNSTCVLHIGVKCDYRTPPSTTSIVVDITTEFLEQDTTWRIIHLYVEGAFANAISIKSSPVSGTSTNPLILIIHNDRMSPVSFSGWYYPSAYETTIYAFYAIDVATSDWEHLYVECPKHMGPDGDVPTGHTSAFMHPSPYVSSDTVIVKEYELEGRRSWEPGGGDYPITYDGTKSYFDYNDEKDMKQYVEKGSLNGLDVFAVGGIAQGHTFPGSVDILISPGNLPEGYYPQSFGAGVYGSMRTTSNGRTCNLICINGVLTVFNLKEGRGEDTMPPRWWSDFCGGSMHAVRTM